MLEQHGENNIKNTPINNELLETDDFEFRPITDGLGFHQDGREKLSYAKIQGKKARLEKQGAALEFSKKKRPPPLSELRPFYAESKETNAVEEIIEEEIPHFIKASLSKRAFAFFIDILLVSTITALLPFGMIATARLPMDQIMATLSSLEMIGFGISFFSVIFFLYFTVLDLGGTFGKGLLGIKVIRQSGKKLTMKETLVRTIISFLSLILGLVPMILDFQGKLTDTEVVEDV